MENKEYYNSRINEGKFRINSEMTHADAIFHLHLFILNFERRGYLLFIGISSPSLLHKTLNPNS